MSFRLLSTAALVCLSSACIPFWLTDAFTLPCVSNDDCEGGYVCDAAAEACLPVLTGDGGTGEVIACPAEGLSQTVAGADVAQLDCSGAVLGSLVLLGAESLSSLEGVTSIQGSLRIENSPGLTELTGLDGVISVGGDLEIVGTAITSLTGLEALRSLSGQLVLEQNDSLTQLDALNLNDLGGSLVVDDCDALVSLEMPTLPSQIGSLFIVDNAGLTSVDGLEDLRQVEDLEITGNPALTDLAGLCDLYGAFHVEGGITGLRSVITENPMLPRYEAGCIAVNKINLDRLQMQGELGLVIDTTNNLPDSDNGTCSCP